MGSSALSTTDWSATGRVSKTWLVQLIEMGSGWNDAVLFAESWRRARDGGDLAQLAELAEALAASRERHAETMLLGSAFLASVAAWPQPGLAGLPADCPYCVAVGATAGAHGIDLRDALPAFLQGFVSNLIQAAIRLGVTGQNGAVAVLAALEPLLLETASRAANSTLDDLGSATLDVRHRGDEARNAIFEAVPLMIAALGDCRPGAFRDRRASRLLGLRRRLAGHRCRLLRPNRWRLSRCRARMPGPGPCLAVTAALAAAALIALAQGGWIVLPLPALLFTLAAAGLSRWFSSDAALPASRQRGDALRLKCHSRGLIANIIRRSAC